MSRVSERISGMFAARKNPAALEFGVTPGTDHEFARERAARSLGRPQSRRRSWSDGALHLFPRLIAEGNYSRIGHARVLL